MADNEHDIPEGGRPTTQPGNGADPRDETPPAKEYAEGEGEHATDPDAGPVPVTAFLVLLYPDGHVEAATDLPSVEVHRKAGLRDIRDACASLGADVTATIHANMLSQVMAASVQKAMEARQAAALREKIAGVGGMGVAMPPGRMRR